MLEAFFNGRNNTVTLGDWRGGGEPPSRDVDETASLSLA
jgi:hypothetical protein